MASLSFDDLVAAEQSDGLEFLAKGGAKVMLRSVLVLPREDQKLLLTLIESMDAEKSDVEKMEDTVDRILVTAADKKEPMKKSLAVLRLKSKATLVKEWMNASDLPEA